MSNNKNKLECFSLFSSLIFIMLNKLKLITAVSFSSLLLAGSINAQGMMDTPEVAEVSEKVEKKEVDKDLSPVGSFFSGMTFSLEDGKFNDTPLEEARYYILYFSASW